MRIILFIEDKETIKKILVHLGLWETRNHDPPTKKTIEANHIVPELSEMVYDDFSNYSQVAEEHYS